MKFFFGIVVTWIANLIAGAFMTGLLLPSFERSNSFIPTKFIAPKSIGNFLESTFLHAAWASICSCWLFIIIFIVYIIFVTRGKNFKLPVVFTYWMGTVIYFVGFWIVLGDFPLILIPYIPFGILFFRLFLNIRLWKLSSS